MREGKGGGASAAAGGEDPEREAEEGQNLERCRNGWLVVVSSTKILATHRTKVAGSYARGG